MSKTRRTTGARKQEKKKPPLGTVSVWITILSVPIIVYQLVSGESSSRKIDEIEKRSPDLHGGLSPHFKAGERKECPDRPANATDLHLADVTFRVLGPTASTIVRSNGEDLLKISRFGELVYMTAIVRDKSGNMIAEIEQNKFTVNPSNYFTVTSGSNELIVRGLDGETAFRITYLAEHEIQVAGRLVSRDGKHVVEISERGLLFDGQRQLIDSRFIFRPSPLLTVIDI